MMRTILKPSDRKRLFRVRDDQTKRARILWAPDFITAFLRFYVNMDKDEYEELEDLEVELGGATGGVMHIWIKEELYMVEDITSDKELYT
jgi:hypothetical protein